jgi:hypothetical protein
MFAVAVIGARRRRQGIGEHVARYFARHGAHVRAIVGTSPDTVAEAARALAVRHGLHGVRGYTSLEALLEREPLDALAICSPVAAHRAALEAAAARGLHVLCEKPLVFEPEADMAALARAIAARFRAAGRLLATVTQWPFTLPGFRALHPDADLAAPRRFEMRLSPVSLGLDMVVDSLPHPLSMLRALVGPGTARLLSARPLGAAAEAATLAFAYDQPRPAWYAVDGFRAERLVHLPSYAMELLSPDGRRVAIADPLERLVGDFLARAAGGEETDVEGIASDAAALQAIARGISCEPDPNPPPPRRP